MDPDLAKRLHRSTLNKLRHHNFLRTNQFDVKSQLDGYEERFRVQDREALADALRECLDIIYSSETSWTPDILHFLLNLADKPTQKSRLADLDHLRKENEDPGVKLTWKSIAKEDGWYDERDIWQRPNFAGSSEDEEEPSLFEPDGDNDVWDDIIPIIPYEDSRRPRAEDHVVVTSDDEMLHKVELSQFWRKETPFSESLGGQGKISISEFQAVRETLFLFSGLKTTLFSEDGSATDKYQITGMEWETQRALLHSISQSNMALRILRQNVTRNQHIPLLQVFQLCIERSLSSFNKVMSEMQQRLMAITGDTVVSLLCILEETRPHIIEISLLSTIVERLQKEPYSHPFHYLELLFEATCSAQLAGNENAYQFLGRIFYDCFRVYVRPIRLWMEEGVLLPGDKTFFVSESATQVPLNQIWQSQFKLRRTSQGILHVPAFLQPATHKIFTAGKSVVILKNLRRYEAAKAEWKFEEPELDFDALTSPDTRLAPFSELFNSAFKKWVQSKHHAASTTLQAVLFNSCGLWNALDALARVFFMSDGSMSVGFAAGLFRSLDSINPCWHDRFSLTELAHEAFESDLDVEKLLIHVAPAGQRCSLEDARTSVKQSLSAIKPIYKLTWPVQLVLMSDSILRYQSIFVLLLQVRRALYALNAHRLLKDLGSDGHNHEEHCKYYALRARLMWFCELFQTYLLTLVIAPGLEKMKENIRMAEDVDAMIAVHSRFLKATEDECCIGSKLAPIHRCILDVFDLCLRLSEAQIANEIREKEELQEMSRLSVMASPMKTPRKQDSQRKTGEFRKLQDLEDEETMKFSGGFVEIAPQELSQPYLDVLDEVQGDFERHMRFIMSGLKAVARASSGTSSSKWEMLAEMMETGFGGRSEF